MEPQGPPAGPDCVARVVPTLKPDHVVHPLREQIRGLALPLIPPLSSYEDGGRHPGSRARGPREGTIRAPDPPTPIARCGT